MTVFPYGFVVNNPATPGSRLLPDNPAPGQFDGVVTFAFKVPLQASDADDPYSVTAVFLAVDDTETRITESLEEQGTSSVQAGADALGSQASVTLLGNSSTVVVGHGVRRICRVRTAGTDPANPAATLVDAGDGCSAGAVTLPSNVVVVDADAAPDGDGRSWATAFRYLQDALACVRDEAGAGQACEGVTEIWIAEGTYYPDEGAGQTDNNVHSRFELVEGVSLYGGFSGAEYARDQRDWRAHPTILDGDLNQNGTFAGNAFSILNLGSTGMRSVVVDGFTVRGANSGGSAAIYCAVGDNQICAPTLRNLIVTQNRGDFGAVLIASLGDGIASPVFDGVTFVANEATALAGAVYVRVMDGVSMPVFLRSTFDDNSGDVGGAINAERVAGTGTLEISFHDVVFRNNDASSSGGAGHFHDATVRFTNTEFWNNTAQTAGAIYATAGSDVTIANSTLAGNTATTGGAVTADASTGSLAVYNSILYGNAPEQVTSTGLASATASFNLIEGGCPALFTTCTSVIDADPAFVSLPAGDLRLGGASPAVDAGSNALLPMDVFDLDGDGDTTEPLPLDLAGRRRVVDWSGTSTTPIVDMGAYERQ